MSVPSVQFSRGKRAPPGRRGAPQQKRAPPPKTRNITFSSDESDSSDDLPTITLTDSTEQNAVIPIEIDSDPEENKEDSDSPPVQEVNWASKQRTNRPQPRGRGRPQRSQYDTYDEEPARPQRKIVRRAKRGRGRAVQRPIKQEIIIEDEEEEEDEPAPAPVVQYRKPQPPPQPAPTPVPVPIPTPQPMQLPPPPVDTAIRKYQIIRTKAALAMSYETEPILFSTQCYDELNNIAVFTSKQDCTTEAPYFKGFIRYQDNHSRFTICSNQKRELDDRDPEIAGLAILSTHKKIRNCLLVLPANHEPHYPISKRLNLSRIAKAGPNGEESHNPRFEFYTSEAPTRLPNGKFGLKFDTDFTETSIKNVIFKDKTGDVIFMLYKASDNVFNVRAKFPITPVLAFGIADAMIRGSEKFFSTF